LVAAIDGLAAARALRRAVRVGNVSLYNRSATGKHVAPSPIVGCDRRARRRLVRIDPATLLQERHHETAWFAEVAAFVIEVAEPDAFARLTAHHRVSAYEAGVVIAGPDAVIGSERVPIAGLREAWEAPLRDFYGSAA
jgi:hypothetical protein